MGERAREASDLAPLRGYQGYCKKHPWVLVKKGFMKNFPIRKRIQTALS